MSRRRLSPTQWLDEGPQIARSSTSNGAVNVGEMRPISKGMYLENRHRAKPPQAFSLHPEKRKP